MIEALKLLHELSESLSSRCGTYSIRHLYPDEPIPQFGHDFPSSPLQQPEWVWIAEKLDQPIAILITSPMQGVVMLLRIYVTNNAPKSTLLSLFRKSLADMQSRGYTQYAVFLDRDQAQCKKLLKIATKAGAKVIEGNHVLVAGPIDIKGW